MPQSVDDHFILRFCITKARQDLRLTKVGPAQACAAMKISIAGRTQRIAVRASP